jgi:hypothetical protein
VGVHRLEAWAALQNRRGNGELRKLGAVTEGHLQLVVVRRGAFATFELLCRTFADDPDVRVVWDRRVTQRRQASSQPETERRTCDRRRLTKSWTHLSYLVVPTGGVGLEHRAT